MSFIESINWAELTPAVATIVIFGGVGMTIGIYAIKKVTSLLSRWQEALSVSERLNFEREDKLYILIDRVATRLTEMKSCIEENNQQIEELRKITERKPLCLAPIGKMEAVLERLESKERKND